MSASGGGGGGRQGQKISSESLGGIIQKNSGGLIQGAIFGAVWIWGPNLSWWQWVLVALVGFIVMMYFRQSSMLYPRCPPNMPKTPADNPPTYKSPAEHNIKHEEVYMDTPDGCRIHAWFMPHTGNPKKVPTVIFFHGNAGNIGYRLPLLKDLYHKGRMNIFAVDYRGYGFSTGEPSEDGLKIDAATALDWVLAHPDVDPTRIVLFGKSLGGAVAISLAVARPHHVHGVMLENTFSNIVTLAQELMPLVALVKPALPYLLHNKWDSVSIIDQVRVPIQFVSGKNDNVIKPHHMKALARAAMQTNAKVSFASLSGSHNDLPLVAGPIYQETINKFLRQFEDDTEENIANPDVAAADNSSPDAAEATASSSGDDDVHHDEKEDDLGVVNAASTTSQ